MMCRLCLAVMFSLATMLVFCTAIGHGQQRMGEPAPNTIASKSKAEQKHFETDQANTNNSTPTSKETESPKTPSLIDILDKYKSLIAAITAFSTLLAVLVALYLGDWKARLEKPRLKLSYVENKEYPYFHTLAFEPFGIPVDIHGQITDIYRPGFNARVKVVNTGKTTAKNVEAKIEKIEFYRNNSTIAPTRYYHPTTVKWSGEREWDPVDIVPESHFFLDLFWSKSETTSEIFSFNDTRIRHSGISLRSDLLKEIIENDIQPTQEIYWNVWVDNSYERGLPRKYNIQGDIVIYFVVNAANCDPLRFEAIVKWTADTWNCPDIKIRMGKEFINKE